MLQNNAVVLEDSGEGCAPGVTTSSKTCGENKLEPLMGKVKQILACHMITTVLDGVDMQQGRCNQVLVFVEQRFLVSWRYKGAVVPLVSPLYLDLSIC